MVAGISLWLRHGHLRVSARICCDRSRMISRLSLAKARSVSLSNADTHTSYGLGVLKTCAELIGSSHGILDQESQFTDLAFDGSCCLIPMKTRFCNWSGGSIDSPLEADRKSLHLEHLPQPSLDCESAFYLINSISCQRVRFSACQINKIKFSFECNLH